MNLVKLLKKEILPKVKINEEKRIVYIEEGLFFSNISEAYYTIKGYSVKRR
jgi:hypothetical protein